MKRIYVKPCIKLVSCRPACFITGSAQWGIGAEGDPTEQPIGPDEPIPRTARESKYIWDEE